jgi:hypothetical protein
MPGDLPVPVLFSVLAARRTAGADSDSAGVAVARAHAAGSDEADAEQP